MSTFAVAKDRGIEPDARQRKLAKVDGHARYTDAVGQSTSAYRSLMAVLVTGQSNPADILALQRSSGNHAVSVLLAKAGPGSRIQPQPVAGAPMVVQRAPAPTESWVEQLVKDLNRRQTQLKKRSRLLGKGIYLLTRPDSYATRSYLSRHRGLTHADVVRRVKERVKPLLSEPDRQRIDAMGAKPFGNYLARRFSLWGCDALLRASLGELYRREGKSAAGESIPTGETFQIAQALRSKGWKSYLLDLTIRNAGQVERHREQFEKDTKVDIDEVLTKQDVDDGELAQITSHEYYFGMTYGAFHNFVGSRETTFHGQWDVFPGERKPPMVTHESLGHCLSHYLRLAIVVPESA